MTDTELTPDDRLDAKQLAAMQAVDDAVRAGYISRAVAEPLEEMIRRGHPAGARKRLTAAKRHGWAR